MTEPLAAQLLAALEVAAFEYRADGSFRLIGLPPLWLIRLTGAADEGQQIDLAAAFPAMEPFFVDTPSLWRQMGPERVRFGRWTVSDVSGNIFEFEGSTVWLGTRRTLLILPTDPAYVETLRKARQIILRSETET